MAHTNKVIRSIETQDGTRCVDITLSPDGSFGFAEFRRDPEDGSGWHPAGAPGAAGFSDAAEALAEAQRHVPWLAMVLG